MYLGTAAATAARGQLVKHQRRAVPGSGQMRARRVGEGAELGEVAAAAEGRAVAGQHHLVDGRVEAGNVERLEKRGPRIGRERVVSLWPVESDLQGVSVSLGQHRIRDVGHLGRSALSEPARELRARLQRRIRQRFGDDAGQRGPGRFDRSQHVVTDRRGLRPALAALGEFGERVGHGCDRDDATVVALGVGQRESGSLKPVFGVRGRNLGGGADRDDYFPGERTSLTSTSR